MKRYWLSAGAGIVLSMMIAGCNRAPAPVPEPVNEVAQEAPVAPKVDTATCKFCAEPATVRVCDVHTGVRTTLHWHLADSGAQVVNIFVVDEGGVEQPFAQQGPDGELESGPWLRPGLIFRVRNDSDSSQLAELVIDGQDC